MAYFPMFFDIKEQKCLIIGGGKVATRKVKVLLDFDADIYVVSPEVCDEIRELAASYNKVRYEKREFCEEDLENAVMVIIATDDSVFNKKTASLCKSKRIPVNVVDSREDCSFILPSYLRENDVVAAFSSSGKSPVLTQFLKEKEREFLTSYVGDVNEYLGAHRNDVKVLFSDEETRKKAFNYLLDYCLKYGKIPDDKMTMALLDNFKKDSE